MNINIKIPALLGDESILIDWNYPCLPQLDNEIELLYLVTQEQKLKLIPFWIKRVIQDEIIHSEELTLNSSKRFEVVGNYISSSGFDFNNIVLLENYKEIEYPYSVILHFDFDIINYSIHSKVSNVIWTRQGPVVTLDFK
jgi:hypothetical protein